MLLYKHSICNLNHEINRKLCVAGIQNQEKRSQKGKVYKKQSEVIRYAQGRHQNIKPVKLGTLSQPPILRLGHFCRYLQMGWDILTIAADPPSPCCYNVPNLVFTVSISVSDLLLVYSFLPSLHSSDHETYRFKTNYFRLVIGI